MTTTTQLHLLEPVQLSLFDAAAGRAARDAGMSQALHASGVIGLTWAEYAYRQLETVARRQATVHTDDVAPLMAVWPAAHPNAWGAVWLRAARAGLIAKSGQYRPTTQPGKHYHASPVWRSLVYRQEGSAG